MHCLVDGVYDKSIIEGRDIVGMILENFMLVLVYFIVGMILEKFMLVLVYLGEIEKE